MSVRRVAARWLLGHIGSELERCRTVVISGTRGGDFARDDEARAPRGAVRCQPRPLSRRSPLPRACLSFRGKTRTPPLSQEQYTQAAEPQESAGQAVAALQERVKSLEASLTEAELKEATENAEALLAEESQGSAEAESPDGGVDPTPEQWVEICSLPPEMVPIGATTS